MLFFLRIDLLLAVVEGLRTRGRAAANEASYTFGEFVRDFGRVYETDDEYERREAIFQDSLSQIGAKNSRGGRSWTAGVHPFMDWTGAEREKLHGYKPSGSRADAPMAALQTSGDRSTGLAADEAAFGDQVYGSAGDSFEAETPPTRNQGVCGSCWALASVGAVEAQLMKANSTWPRRLGQPRVSVQALLDCVQNPRHCGGNGGCEGATPELAFDYMRTKGVPLEVKLPYHPADTGKCPIEPYPSDWVRVTLSGWLALPRNQAQPLMRALVENGPAVVAVAAHDWYHYKSGIFDECQRDAIPNHSVLARGYGDVAGIKYWLLQNSWGTQWGMDGHIRLIRHNDEDSWCGIDSRPQDGSACDGEADKNITVCGSCGILYDPVVPQVGPVMIGNFPYTATSAAFAAKVDPGTEADVAKFDEGMQAYQGQGGGTVDAGNLTKEALSYASAPESNEAPSYARAPESMTTAPTASAARQVELVVQKFAFAKSADESTQLPDEFSANSARVADEFPSDGKGSQVELGTISTRTSQSYADDSAPDLSPKASQPHGDQNLAPEAGRFESDNDSLESSDSLADYLHR